jgi:hypothetical protein
MLHCTALHAEMKSLMAIIMDLSFKILHEGL